MNRAAETHVKRTISLPRPLVEKIVAQTSNVSAFIAQACQEKLAADARRTLEAEMIERCRVRYQEDLELLRDFSHADQEGW